MKHFGLELEHHYKNQFVGRHILHAGQKPVVLGESRNADIRLLGEDVSAIHAYIEFQNGMWTVSDAGSQQGTWLQKKPVTFATISGETTITIGGHTLKLIPHAVEKEVFSPESFKNYKAKGGKTYHQVIVRRGEAILRTTMMPSDQSFAYLFAGQEHILTPPKSDEVKETVFGATTVFQRTVKSDDLHITSKDFFANLKNPEMRTPVLAALILIFILSTLIFAIPHKPEDELADVKPDNKYTRMIFDAALMKKKRAEAKEIRQAMAAKSPEHAQEKNVLSTPVRSHGATPKVISKLKLEGLNSLLGKIAMRANSKGPMITGFGKTADNANTGHVTTVAAIGSLQGIATQAGNGGDTYKVGGVGTIGKGGGKGRALAGLGGLVTGGAGTGTVGILDEETEIEGGLDKEVIAKVISNYLGEVRYCYERQLSAEPDIYGKVQVKFTIDGSGSVLEQRVGATTLKSAMVEGCILRRLARWKFPKPKGGTHVLVTYPFMFKATN